MLACSFFPKDHRVHLKEIIPNVFLEHHIAFEFLGEEIDSFFVEIIMLYVQFIFIYIMCFY